MQTAFAPSPTAPDSTPITPDDLARLLLPLGWAALDVLLAAACRHGSAPHQQEWTPLLQQTGFLLCQALNAQESSHG